MGTTKRPMTHTIIYVLFAITATLILLNRYTSLYINNAIVHFTLLFIAAGSFIVIMGHFFGKLKTNKSIAFTFVMVGLLCFLRSFLTWGGDWKTQTVAYRNLNNRRRTIEYQMRGDRFSFGYKKRVISRLKIVPFIDWNTDIDTLSLDAAKWSRADENVNEMGFKDQ
jgi:hypothetical protein